MTQIIARGSKEGTVNLYARLYKRPTINTTIALGISLSSQDWQYIDKVLKSAEQAQKMGTAVVLRDTLAQKLWDVKTALDGLILSDNVSNDSAKKLADSILKANIYKEVERQQEEQARKKVLDDGCTIITLTEEELDKFQKAVLPIYETYCSDYMDLLEQIRAVAGEP